MTIPTFSRIEVRHDGKGDLMAASVALTDLAKELRRIAGSDLETRLMRLAAHDAIRDTSSRLRGTSPEKGTT
jgi:hypothetical protein